MVRSRILVATIACAALAGPLAAQGIVRPGSPSLRRLTDSLASARRRAMGGDSALTSPGVTRLQVPELFAGSRPIARTADPAHAEHPAQCPMPVAKADLSAITPIPTSRIEAGKLEPMPVARGHCSNPLNRP